MDETGIGRAVNIHLQTSPRFPRFRGTPPRRACYFHEDIVEPPVELDEHGFIAVPDGPGIGVRINDDRSEEAHAADGTSPVIAGSIVIGMVEQDGTTVTAMTKLRIVIACLMSISLPGFISGQSAPARTSVTADFVAPAPAEPFSGALGNGVAAITASSLGAHVAFLASPALEGRGLGARGLDAAAEYAAAGLKLAGIAPFGATVDRKAERSSYFQLVPVRQFTGTTGQLEIERREGERASSRVFLYGVDCLFPAAPPQNLEATVVFAGFGVREPKLGRDDYAGLDVRGRIVLILGGLPAGPEWKARELIDRYAADDAGDRWAAKVDIAKKLGAVAVLAVEDEDFGTRLTADQLEEERAFRAYDRPAGDDAPLVVRVSHAVARAIVGDETLADGAPKSGRTTLSGIRAKIRISGNERLIVSRNVIGVIPGADAKLREEAVVIGAHIDHLGKVGDVVHPGADDNASGVAALLEIARAFAASPEKPKRTIVFAFWTGEEEGKFGSGFFVRHPRWPLGRTVAYLNLDMIGHPWLAEEIRKLVTDAGLPDGEAFIASVKPPDFMEAGLPRESPALEAALRKSARGNGLALHFDWTDGKHGGSDYRDFARAGVPFIRFFGNFFPAYHEPGDTPERLDAEQVQRVARLAFATAWELANP